MASFSRETHETTTRGKPLILGARVYSQVGPQAAASIIRKGVLHGGVGEGDVLLGEAQLPFSLLKELPFHYLPLRLHQPPASPPLRTAPNGVCSGGRGVDGKPESDHTHCRTASGGTGRNTLERNAGDTHGDETDVGLLGVGVRMVFPNPTIPDAPDDSSSHRDSVLSSAVAPIAGRPADAGKGPAMGGAVVGGNKVVLSVYEAEALVSFRRQVWSI